MDRTSSSPPTGAAIYLAHPIDQRVGDDEVELRLVRDELRHAGCHVYDPAQAWSCNPGHPSGVIQSVNDAAIHQCDAVVAWLPEGVASIGVPMEIQIAAQLGKPVVVLTTVRSFALAALPGVRVVDRVDSVMATLRAVLARQQAERDAAAALQEWENTPQRVVLGQHLAGWDNDPGPPPTPLVYEAPEGAGGGLELHHDGDAGWDLVTADTTVVPAGAYRLVRCGVKIAWPSGYWGLILPRSSTLKDRGLMVSPAVIDQGWRGDYFAAVWNLGTESVVVNPGDRLAQVVPMPLTIDELKPVAGRVLNDTQRGDRGFGSTNLPPVARADLGDDLDECRPEVNCDGREPRHH